MRYDDAILHRRPISLWLRLKLWFRQTPPSTEEHYDRLNHLTDRDRRDIGLPEPVRYMDWSALQRETWR